MIELCTVLCITLELDSDMPRIILDLGDCRSDLLARVSCLLGKCLFFSVGEREILGGRSPEVG